MLVRAADGRWRTLDARGLLVHMKTAGYTYDAQLRHELTERFGAAWSPVVSGFADISEIDAEVRGLQHHGQDSGMSITRTGARVSIEFALATGDATEVDARDRAMECVACSGMQPGPATTPGTAKPLP